MELKALYSSSPQATTGTCTPFAKPPTMHLLYCFAASALAVFAIELSMRVCCPLYQRPSHLLQFFAYVAEEIFSAAGRVFVHVCNVVGHLKWLLSFLPWQEAYLAAMDLLQPILTLLQSPFCFVKGYIAALRTVQLPHLTALVSVAVCFASVGGIGYLLGGHEVIQHWMQTEWQKHQQDKEYQPDSIVPLCLG